MLMLAEEAAEMFPEAFYSHRCQLCGAESGHKTTCTIRVEQTVTDLLNGLARAVLADSALRRGDGIETPYEAAVAAVVMFEKAGMRAEAELWRKVAEQVKLRGPSARADGLPRTAAAICGCFAAAYGAESVRVAARRVESGGENE